MAYILQYFDELVEETGVYYNKINRISLDHKILSEEIRNEGMLIQDKLREIYYREGEEQWIVPYFLKISKRLISLLNIIDAEISARKPHLIIEYREWANISYENYHSVRREILGILDILNFEFDVPGVDVKKVSESGEQKILRETYFNDHLLLKKYVSEKQEIPQELIDKYDFAYIADDLTPEYFQYSKLHSLQEEIGIDTLKFTYSIEELAEEYQRDFINGKQERSFVYSHIWEMLLDKTKGISSEEEKKKFIIEFFLHTGLCVSLVIKYFHREIQLIENSDNADVENYLKKLWKWIEEVKAEPKHKKYHVSRIEDTYEDVFVELGNLLRYYEEIYDVKKMVEVDRAEEMSAKTDQISQLIFHKTAKEFGVFIDALDSVKLFPHNTKKEIAYAFASITSDIGGKHLENLSSGWTTDSEEAEYFVKKLNFMLRHIATKENKNKKK